MHVRENVIKSGGKAQIYMTANADLGKKIFLKTDVITVCLLISSFDSSGKHSVCLSIFVLMFSIIYPVIPSLSKIVKVVHLVHLPGEGKIPYVTYFTVVGFFASPSS